MIEIIIKDKSYETGNIFKERWSEVIPAVIIYGYNFETKERKFYYHFSIKIYHSKLKDKKDY